MPDPPSRGRPERAACSIRVRKRTLEKLRDVAYWTKRTVSDLADEAFLDLIHKLENEAKEPFERRDGSIRGRPKKKKKK